MENARVYRASYMDPGTNYTAVRGNMGWRRWVFCEFYGMLGVAQHPLLEDHERNVRQGFEL